MRITPDLQGWQFATLHYDGGHKFTATFGLETYDALLATRITVLHMLLTWMLGRRLLAHGQNPDVLQRRESILDLGRALGASKLLFERGGLS